MTTEIAIRATLVGEGTSDAAFVPILEWLLNDMTATDIEVAWTDFSLHGGKPSNLGVRVQTAFKIYPCELLFIHRDQDNSTIAQRAAEIKRAAPSGPVVVPVIPIRMLEAWLCFDESAIRWAADNPNPRRRQNLGLKNAKELARLADPKAHLADALRAAAKPGRNKPKIGQRINRVAERIEDWSPLRKHPAFQKLETDLRNALVAMGVTLRIP